MTDLVLERKFAAALTPADVMAMAVEAAGCFGIHRIEWNMSLLAGSGRRLACWFTAPDMESARIAMRKSNIDASVVWPCDVYAGPALSEQDLQSANVLVERSFDESVSLQDIQAIEDAGAHCLEIRNVRFIRTFFSRDRKRMLCLYAAPDAESVRAAQREAGVPFTDAWPFVTVSPKSTFP